MEMLKNLTKIQNVLITIMRISYRKIIKNNIYALHFFFYFKLIKTQIN